MVCFFVDVMELVSTAKEEAGVTGLALDFKRLAGLFYPPTVMLISWLQRPTCWSPTR